MKRQTVVIKKHMNIILASTNADIVYVCFATLRITLANINLGSNRSVFYEICVTDLLE